MISWEEWHSVDMEAFPKLYKLCFDDCPKLIGNFPLQLVSLVGLEIKACPLLASPIPKYPKMYDLRIIKSQNVVLQEQALPPCLLLLEFSDARILESLPKKLHIASLIIRNCSDAMPLSVIHMPPSLVENLILEDYDNLKFVLISKAPLVHLGSIFIYECKFLKSLLDDMERLLPDLIKLGIRRCPEMEPFSAGSLPSSLKELEIRECDKLLSNHTEWHHLPTITQLLISTPSDTLPCRGLQHLTSLQELQILDSPKLKTIEGGMMPPSLQRLIISGCCLLEERCRNKDEEIWPKISHVPHISLDGTDLRFLIRMESLGFIPPYKTHEQKKRKQGAAFNPSHVHQQGKKFQMYNSNRKQLDEGAQKENGVDVDERGDRTSEKSLKTTHSTQIELQTSLSICFRFHPFSCTPETHSVEKGEEDRMKSSSQSHDTSSRTCR